MHFGPAGVRVAEPCPSSALRPVGPACSSPGSKDGGHGSARTNHPALRCSRGQTLGNLREREQIQKALRLLLVSFIISKNHGSITCEVDIQKKSGIICGDEQYITIHPEDLDEQ